MNHDDEPGRNDEFALRRALQQLPRERDPSRDLWNGIQQRLDAPARAGRPARASMLAGLAAALVLALALGVALRFAPPDPAVHAPQSVRDAAPVPASSPLLRHEADAMTIEFEAALAGFDASNLSPDLRAAATELDASATQLREALRVQPEAAYLLERLRQTYELRLKLSQRALLG